MADENVQKLEINMAEVKKDIQNLSQKVEDNAVVTKESISELKAAIKDFIDKADERYASKQIERWFYALAGIVGTSLVVAILKLVIK